MDMLRLQLHEMRRFSTIFVISEQHYPPTKGKRAACHVDVRLRQNLIIASVNQPINAKMNVFDEKKEKKFWLEFFC